MNLDYKNIKQVGLVAKISDELNTNFKILSEILGKYGVSILVENNTAKALKTKGYDLKDIALKTSFIISLGGDGTIISLCRKCAKLQPFVLGIHAGTLGFLTDITMNEADIFFKEFFKGEFEIEEPFMLDLFLKKHSGETIHKVAFNDAVIMRAKPASIACIDVFLNSKCFNSYYGDGLIVATPVGSTAYNMSASGPIIYPLSDVFALTPICSHSLTQHPIILPKGFFVEIKAYKDEVLVIDGQDTFSMQNYESVKVGLSNFYARLIRHIGRDYFQILKEKLSWGQQ